MLTNARRAGALSFDSLADQKSAAYTVQNVFRERIDGSGGRNQSDYFETSVTSL